MAARAGRSGAVSTYLSCFTSPLHSPCAEHSELLSVSLDASCCFWPTVLALAVLCACSSPSSPPWLIPIDPSSLHLVSLLPGSLPGVHP